MQTTEAGLQTELEGLLDKFSGTSTNDEKLQISTFKVVFVYITTTYIPISIVWVTDKVEKMYLLYQQLCRCQLDHSVNTSLEIQTDLETR